MKLPVNPSNSRNIIKVYDAYKDIRLLKSTIIEGEEYLYVVDEAKFVKILKNEENKLSVHKEYFVESTFASNSDVDQIKEFWYSNEMMYSVNGGYILQGKGKSKEGKFPPLNYSGISVDYHNKNFPICSDDFVLYALAPELSYNNSQQNAYLLWAPPMNSHRIKQRDIDPSWIHEFYLWFDDRYIAQYYYTLSEISISLFNLNGSISQRVKITPGDIIFRPWISQTGEYMVVPAIISTGDKSENKKASKKNIFGTQDTRRKATNIHTFKLYRFRKWNNYK